MAALRRIPRRILSQLSQSNSTLLPSSFLHPSPSLFISRRGITSKLFIGVAHCASKLLQNERPVIFGTRCASSLPSSDTRPVDWELLFAGTYLFFKITIGAGLSFYTTDKGLLEAFSQYGQVVEAKVVMDRVSDRSKGFGFVTFASEEEAEKAKAEMDGKALNGRAIFVDYAKPRINYIDGMPIARGPPEPTTDQ